MTTKWQVYKCSRCKKWKVAWQDEETETGGIAAEFKTWDEAIRWALYGDSK